MNIGNEASDFNNESEIEPTNFSNTNLQEASQEEEGCHSTGNGSESASSLLISHASNCSSNSSNDVIDYAAASKSDVISRKRMLPPTRELPNRFKRAASNELIATATAATSTSTPTITRMHAEGIDDDKDEPLTEKEHRDLVAAIFNIGLEHSSPRAISDNMTGKIKATYTALTLEKIKSKLQKYRKSKAKNTDEFMQIYDSTLAQMMSAYPLKNNGVTAKIPVSTTANLASGEIAAYLTHTIVSGNQSAIKSIETQFEYSSPMNKTHESCEGDTSPIQPDWPLEVEVPPQLESDKVPPSNGGSLEFPALTAQERLSPIGASFDYFLGLFNSLRADIYQSRAADGIVIPQPPSLPLRTGMINTTDASEPLDTLRSQKENESNQSFFADKNLIPGEQFLPDQLQLQQSFAIADEGATILAGLAGGASPCAGVQQLHVGREGNTTHASVGELFESSAPREGQQK
jgi:SHAQKYF class myb-like DNA-binding protein